MRTIIIGVLMLGFVGALFSFLGKDSIPSAIASSDDESPAFAHNPNPDSNVITVVAVGDIMIGSNFPNVGFLPDDDGKTSFDAVKPFLQGDVVFGNLEGVLLDKGASPKCPNDETTEIVTPTKMCYAFRMPVRYGQFIKDAGFNVLSIANNHIGDFGDAGRASTMQTLDKLGIHYAGLQSKPVALFEQNGVTYGFAAFAPNLATVSLHDITGAKNIVKQLDSKADIVIVSFHGGAEGAEHTRVPKTTEMFMNENRGDVHAFAHAVIDAGADVVLGHGPHVTRAVELYNNRLIAYSLGNFNTYGAFNVKGVNGIAPILSITLQPDGSFVSADVISTKQTKTNRLQLDNTNAAFNELKKLSELDFPTQNLVFKDNRIYQP